MTHDDALRTMSTERYVLGELQDGERDDYEEHLFGANSVWRSFGLHRCLWTGRAPSSVPCRLFRSRRHRAG